MLVHEEALLWSVEEIAREIKTNPVDSLERLHGGGFIHRLENYAWGLWRHAPEASRARGSRSHAGRKSPPARRAPTSASMRADVPPLAVPLIPLMRGPLSP